MSARVRVATVVRPHGVRGAVLVRDTSDIEGRFSLGATFYLDDGDPLTLVDVGGTRERLILRFAEISDRDAAAALRGRSLWADRLASAADVTLVADLIGRDVVDQRGLYLGRVVAVEANPASELLVLEDGQLIPSVFIVGISGKGIVVDPPAGLFDL